MSIKLIASRVGVSTSTVSRVLNNPEYKCGTPDLREKIWKVAMEMNYTPNVAARNLKKGKEYTATKTYYINVLMTRMDKSQTDPFFNEVLHVVESQTHENGCILSSLWYNSLFSDDRRCSEVNIDRAIAEMNEDSNGRKDGLIIIGRCNKLALQKLTKQYKAIVSINRNSTNYEVDEVICDGKKIASMAVEYLCSLGHTNIGYVGVCHNEDRYLGFIETLRKHDLDIMPSNVVDTPQSEANGYEVMESFIKNSIFPTGIYCANDITAIGMLKCLAKYKNGLYKPSIISSDDIEAAQYSKPMLTTINLPKEDMGKFALSLLVDRLKGGHERVVKMELTGKLMIRDSCKRVNESILNDYII